MIPSSMSLVDSFQSSVRVEELLSIHRYRSLETIVMNVGSLRTSAKISIAYGRAFTSKTFMLPDATPKGLTKDVLGYFLLLRFQVDSIHRPIPG